MFPSDTNTWRVVNQVHGKSHSFGMGGFNDFSMAFAIGIGYDRGFVPAEVSMSDSYDESYSIALAYWRSQSDQDREDTIDLSQIWEDASMDRDKFTGRLGATSTVVQMMAGYEAVTSRDYSIAIQEHNNFPGFYRAIIETTSGWMNVQNNNVYVLSDFLSFENGSWKETNFNVAKNK